MSFTNADLNKRIQVSTEGQYLKILVDGVYRTHMQKTATSGVCTNDEPPWWAGKGASFLCTTVTYIDSRLCLTDNGKAEKYCEQSCYNQGYPYESEYPSAAAMHAACSNWPSIDNFDGYICALEEKVAGWMGLSQTTDCTPQNLQGFENPSIHLEPGSGENVEQVSASQTWSTLKPGIFLKADTSSCTWGNYIQLSTGEIYRHDSRLELVKNTPEQPASYTGDTCPTVAKSFLNEKNCKLVSTCIPLHLQNSLFQLNASSLENFYTVGQKYVYAITGLRASGGPCGSLSRWEKLDCSAASCTVTGGVDASDLTMVTDALNSADGWLRDVDINCASVPANAIVQVAVTSSNMCICTSITCTTSPSGCMHIQEQQTSPNPSQSGPQRSKYNSQQVTQWIDGRQEARKTR
jgi:hypothetical protein